MEGKNDTSSIYEQWVDDAIAGKDFASVSVAVWDEGRFAESQQRRTGTFLKLQLFSQKSDRNLSLCRT